MDTQIVEEDGNSFKLVRSSQIQDVINELALVNRFLKDLVILKATLLRDSKD